MLLKIFKSYPTLKIAEPVLASVYTEAVLSAYLMGFTASVPFQFLDQWIALGVSIVLFLLGVWALFANRPRLGLERSLMIGGLSLLVFASSLRGSMLW